MVLTLKNLKEKIDSICEEIGGDLETKIGSHAISPSIQVYLQNEDIDEEFELVDIEPNTLPECGCWDGITIVIRKIN
jgi:hypothetical protein